MEYQEMVMEKSWKNSLSNLWEPWIELTIAKWMLNSNSHHHRHHHRHLCIVVAINKAQRSSTSSKDGRPPVGSRVSLFIIVSTIPYIYRVYIHEGFQ